VEIYVWLSVTAHTEALRTTWDAFRFLTWLPAATPERHEFPRYPLWYFLTLLDVSSTLKSLKWH